MAMVNDVLHKDRPRSITSPSHEGLFCAYYPKDGK